MEHYKFYLDSNNDEDANDTSSDNSEETTEDADWDVSADTELLKKSQNKDKKDYFER